MPTGIATAGAPSIASSCGRECGYSTSVADLGRLLCRLRRRSAQTVEVLGVDLAEKLLALARAKAQHRGLTNIEFRTGDMLDLGLPEAGFDAVICVFGIFFVPDIPAAVRELWRFVAPGGALAITTWGPRFVEPMGTAFWNAVREEQPDLDRGFNPWDRITEPQALSALFTDAGLPAPQRDPGVRLPAPPLAGGLVDDRARHGFSRHGGCPRPGGSPRTRPPGQPRLHPRRECPGRRNQRDLRHLTPRAARPSRGNPACALRRPGRYDILAASVPATPPPTTVTFAAGVPGTPPSSRPPPPAGVHD